MKKHVIIGSLALLLPAVADAQVGVGPATPVAPPQVAVPAPRVADVPPPGAPGEGAAPAAGPTGYQGGDFIISDNNPALWGGVRGQRRKVPSHHTVSKGDTLWQICDKYYGDPWAWPQLWAYNPSITNPHWIYPGDRITLLGGPAGTGGRAGEAESIRLSRTHMETAGPVLLKQNAFADPQELADSGNVAGSKEEKLLLAQRDEIYIANEGNFRPQVGQSYTIYRVRKKLKSAEGDEVGQLVEIIGTAQVKRAPEGQQATAVITESVGAVERGDRVGPLRRRYKRLPVVRADRDIEATVIDAFLDTRNHGSNELVFVDTGKNQGVVEGNRFLVLQSGDGYERIQTLEEDHDPKWPKEAVAEISVLDARENVSVGLVTRALKEIRIGAKVTMRRGY